MLFITDGIKVIVWICSSQCQSNCNGCHKSGNRSRVSNTGCVLGCSLFACCRVCTQWYHCSAKYEHWPKQFNLC